MRFGSISHSLAEQLILFSLTCIEHVLQGPPAAERREEFMFETPREIKPSASKGLWIGIAVVVIVVGLGAYFLITSRGNANKQANTTAAAAAPTQPKGPADPVRDLKVQRVTMNKDRTGTTAVWLVTIENKSPAYTYSKIQYETTYVGANNNAILINKGTIAQSIPPGEQKNSEINDALYPAGTVWYKFRVTGATPSAP
ncbi:MAG: hypothetical protein DMG35_05330 [Acidobacteria bacterium]|nr:MAG: hypothetical protein AUH86_17195 [Acidobacteria bacterium 13_1_40CM_4_58_4]OLE57230.1 MAG: hypothetical protein AUG13_05015 [Chloroflexi bacterium 13_1_20CM_2_59_7]PYT63076.1 MAG: hypothetical protein DMG35_05330 [Acidobacteriota bacterium]